MKFGQVTILLKLNILFVIYSFLISLFPNGPTSNFFYISQFFFIALFFLQLILPQLANMIEIKYQKFLLHEISLARKAFLTILPMIFIFQYIIINSYFFGKKDILLLSLFFFLVSFSFIFLIPFLTKKIVPSKLHSVINTAIIVIIYGMPSYSYEFGWINSISIFYSISFLVLVITFIFFLTNFNKFLYFPTILILLIGGVALSNNEAKYDQISSKHENKLNLLEDKIIFKNFPDIYFIIYDGYVSGQTYKYYEIDNSSHEQHLKNNGFSVYDDIYTIDIFSAEALAPTFDMSKQQVNELEKRKNIMSGNSFVRRVFKNNGYKTEALLTPYYLVNQVPQYDYTWPPAFYERTSLIVGKEIVRGYFRDQMWKDFNDNITAFMIPEGLQPSNPEFWYDSFDLKKKQQLSILPNEPRLFFAHSPLPGHEAFTGSCQEGHLERFEKKLRRTNSEMVHDIDEILKHKRDSIIILAGDHGPAVLGDCHILKNIDIDDIGRKELQDRWGTFLAIKWPDGYNVRNEEFKILQDIFPIILSNLENNDRLLNFRLEPNTIDRFKLGITIQDGKIIGGKDDGKNLFIK